MKEHLEICDYKVCGYWDEQDEYYEEIILPHLLQTKLVSSAIGVSNNKRFLNLKFLLLNSSSTDNVQSLGELILIYDENLELIDENWILDLNSPRIQAKLG